MKQTANNGVIKAFINQTGEAKNHSNNLRIVGSRLINYSTVIAEWRNGKLLLSDESYSKTTTTHQNKIKQYAPANLLQLVSHKELNR